MSLSVVINTKNASASLEDTLESAQFADEIVVADMQSDDQTRQIAEKYTDQIITVPDVGYVEPARNQALAHAQGDWTLLVDADEVVPASLAELIDQTVARPTADAYYIPRKNIIFNSWIQHTGWWPDYVLRLFRSGVVTWEEKIHSVPQVDGTTDNFPAEERYSLEHHNYRTVSEYLQRLDRYTTVTVQEDAPEENAAKGVGQTLTGAELARTFRQEFLSRLFALHGYKDEAHGVGLSFLQSLYEVVVLLKRWEQHQFAEKSTPSSRELFAELSQFSQELQYWLLTTQIEEASGLSRWWLRLRRRLVST